MPKLSLLGRRMWVEKTVPTFIEEVMPKPSSTRHHYPITYLGVDPGANGGLVAIKGGIIESAIPMPETELEIWHWFQGMSILPFKPTACIEWIHPAIQGIGKSPMSKLYGSYMSLRMALTASQISFEVVMPRKWQAALGVQSRKKTENTTQWKSRLKSHAQRLYPSLSIWKQPRTEGKQKAISDALLIAEYCRRFHEGLLK